MKKYLVLIGLAAALTTGPAGATIIGNKHDFSGASWNTQRHGVCSPCHSIHATDTSSAVPLWAHYTTTQTFTTHTSPFMIDNGVNTNTTLQPSGASKACLSCHDGVTAINQTFSGSFTGGAALSGTAAGLNSGDIIGTDLAATHPISIKFTSALATANPTFYDPNVQHMQWPPSLTGQTIAQAMLKGTNHDTVECSSCHDPHADKGDAAGDTFFRIVTSYNATYDSRGSLLCRTCHNK